jgi:trans-2,3-dihydro-3-hydroxyanthranilate isomerase
MRLQHWYALSLVRRSYRYLHLDVFTSALFGGNQLAVFLDARGLDGRTMQAIAKEMNFSETTFVLPAERADTDMRVRIFTPGAELPMAGHPVIGTAFALARSGIASPDRAGVVFGLGVGPTEVELVWRANCLSFAWMTQLRPVFGQPLPDPAAAARALRLPGAAVASTRLPVQSVSCGVPYLIVPLASRADVDAARFDADAYAAVLASAGIDDQPVFLFSMEPGTDKSTAYSRMFAPGIGIVEDPATGSAAGPLGCYLVRHGAVTEAVARRMINLQGAGMGRPSYIHVSISAAGGDIGTVRVGGESVVAGDGILYV